MSEDSALDERAPLSVMRMCGLPTDGCVGFRHFMRRRLGSVRHYIAYNGRMKVASSRIAHEAMEPIMPDLSSGSFRHITLS